MKNAILAIVSLAVLVCQAQYKTMLHANITPTNSVVVDIPAWAKSDTPPVSEDGILDYNALTNKPSINGTTIEGSLTTEDLGITAGASDYNDLTNKPSINAVELSGSKTAGELGLAFGDEYGSALSALFAERAFSADQVDRAEYASVAGGLSILAEPGVVGGIELMDGISDAKKGISELESSKRDKTDNIVTSEYSYFKEWNFSASWADLQNDLDAYPPTMIWDSEYKFWTIRPKDGAQWLPMQYDLTEDTDINTPSINNIPFMKTDSGEVEYVNASRKKYIVAAVGESYVSPIYVTNTIKEATADHVKSNDLQLAVAPINNNVNTMWGYIYGENVWIAVTNYMRSVGGVAPSLQLWEKRDGQTNLVYWSAEEIDIRVGDKIDIAMFNIVDTVVTAKADRAWSKYQSMTGADNPQPNDVTIVSTPSVMLSGGYEWQRFVDTGAEVWVLKCNDLITLGADTNAYFRITDLEGETQFAIEKTASKLVDAVPTATGFTTDGNNYFKVTFSGNIQPTIYVSLDLVNSPFVECSATENDYGLTCSWDHDSAANTYTATIAYNAGDGKPSKMFVYGKVLQEGSTVVKHTAPSSFDGGIIINGVQYSVGTATIDGNTVMTLNPVTRAVSE